MRRAFSPAFAASSCAATIGATSSTGAEKSCAILLSASKSARARPTARPPHTNSTRTDCRIFSVLRSRIGPISPVVRTCVPPHALRSSPSIDTMRSMPARSGALRNPRAWLAFSKRTSTARFSTTTWLARRSASIAMRASTGPPSRSIVADSAPK